MFTSSLFPFIMVCCMGKKKKKLKIRRCGGIRTMCQETERGRGVPNESSEQTAAEAHWDGFYFWSIPQQVRNKITWKPWYMTNALDQKVVTGYYLHMFFFNVQYACGRRNSSPSSVRWKPGLYEGKKWSVFNWKDCGWLVSFFPGLQTQASEEPNDERWLFSCTYFLTCLPTKQQQVADTKQCRRKRNRAVQLKKKRLFKRW